ncbi:hypothetical protein Ahy_A09g043209 [Arachis hypogaea]|uniref:Uncharacterized protein n=1 Tax=Arachis hypogaea TaxID=3818 RepID=A0A445BHS6_ARAHY|nr:hypothetical protein Ahy_A09g043209 [Arachis hypogaea]
MKEVHRVEGAHMCLAPTMSQDHEHLFISISILQGAVKQSYHFKFSYGKVLRFLQALQSCYPETIFDTSVVPYYDGHLMIRDCIMFDKAFKHRKPFISVDGTRLYGKYARVFLIAVTQGCNSCSLGRDKRHMHN